MKVDERMKRKVITTNPNEKIGEIELIFKNEGIGKLPVMEDGKLVGIITEDDIIGQTKSKKVSSLMSKEVISVSEGTTIEEASRLMLDKDISCLPVLDKELKLTGIITKSDIFRLLLELFGIRHYGVRISFKLKDKRGELKSVLSFLADAGADIVSVGTIKGSEEEGECVIKVQSITPEDVERLFLNHGIKILDLREV